jgi:hypothetical protein
MPEAGRVADRLWTDDHTNADMPGEYLAIWLKTPPEVACDGRVTGVIGPELDDNVTLQA